MTTIPQINANQPLARGHYEEQESPVLYSTIKSRFETPVLNQIKSLDERVTNLKDIAEGFKLQRAALTEKYEEIKEGYSAICGKFYEDPSSDIHKAWLHFEKERVKQPIEMAQDVSSAPCINSKLQATYDAFAGYIEIEQKRQELMGQVDKMGRAVNSDPLLKEHFLATKKELEIELHQLSGDYYEDPNCKLDKSWKTYQDKLSKSASSYEIEESRQSYLRLDQRRKIFEHQLFMVSTMLAAPETEETDIKKIAEKQVCSEIAKTTRLLEQTLNDYCIT